MTRYVLIDGNTGYVWGDATAKSPAAACEIVEREQAGADTARRQYEEHGAQSTALRDGASGYYVHEAPEGWTYPLDGDGQRAEVIAAVAALPLVAQVVTQAIELVACAYCGADVPADERVPAASDDEGWGRAAAAHAADCEWVATRAHRVARAS